MEANRLVFPPKFWNNIYSIDERSPIKVIYIPKPDKETIPCLWLSLPQDKQKSGRKFVLYFHGIGTNIGSRRIQ
jgi:hypothetical protein